MSRKPSEADKAWEDAISRGDMAWLNDTTFVAADYFKPPSNNQPHVWERIAVPPVNLSDSRGRIYKRVPGRSVDTRYNLVAAELDSQGSDQRKRARTTNHKTGWGLLSFDPKYEDAAATVKEEIANARDQVKTAYKQIAKDNRALRNNAPPTKRSTYDPSKLTFAPRKRHNSRWPIVPPTWEKMIAEFQPLIVFEMPIIKTGPPNFFEQFAADTRIELRQYKRTKRGRIIVPPTRLSTISEEPKEPSEVSAKYQPMYKAPTKRWAAAADKYFTMSATSAGVAHHDSEGDKAPIEITNHRGHFRVPSSPLSSRSAATTPAKQNAEDLEEVTNKRGQFRVPSSPLSSRSSTTTDADRKRKAQAEHDEQPAPVRSRSSQPASDPATVAVFDQPAPQVHAEPEHETKRRVSLDNARRSDRPRQLTAFKKVRTWVTNTFSGRRRSFEEAMEEQEGQEESPPTKRRHTLDVDVGTNPDIFGQTAGQDQELSPNANAQPKTKSAKLLKRKVFFAVQDDSLSDMESEYSMARKVIYQKTATTPNASTTLPAYRSAFINWDAIPNIDDRIRDLLDWKADRALGKVVDDYEVNVGDYKVDVGDKVDDGDSISSDDTQPFDESVYERIQSALQPDDDEDMTTGDLDVDTTASNPPATEPLMADSPVDDSSSDDSTVPDLSTAMETPFEAAYRGADADTALPSIEHDVGATFADVMDKAVSDLAAISKPAGVSNADPHAASGQNLNRATRDEPMPNALPVEQPTMTSRPVDPAGGQPDQSVAADAAGQAQAEDDDDSVIYNFLRRARIKTHAVFPSMAAPTSPEPPIQVVWPPMAAPTAPEPRTVPELPSALEPPNDLFAAPKSPRTALAHKDSNMSPITSKTTMSGSPGKKRKLKEAQETPLDMTKTTRLVKPDLDDTTPQPLRKRRRKGAENDAPDEIFNPEMSLSHSLTQRSSSGGPRRSKRVAAPRPRAPSAPSHIPVRLPGSFDADMPAVSTAGVMQQKTERDLTLLTRANTRRNQGAALPVVPRLAGLSQPRTSDDDPFISPEKASGSRASRPVKGVRWADNLVRYQGDDDSDSSASTIAAEASREVSPMAAAPTAVEQPSRPIASAAAQPPVPHVVPAPPPASTSASASASVPPESDKKRSLRPRASRLPAPAAVTKATTPATKTPTKTPTQTTRSKSAAAATTPSRITSTPARRSSTVGARLGTPAAKRRGSAKK